MYSARPAYDSRDPQSIQRGVTVIALIDIDRKDRMAIVMRRSGVELARAAIGAIAVNEFSSTDCPILGQH
jgi:hypothetical protein